MAKKFKPGDIVQLKSGGPSMTVSIALTDGESYFCECFKGASKESASFKEVTLKVYEAPKKVNEDDAARWMLRRFEEAGLLYQEEAGSHLFQLNDKRLAYFDKSSNLCVGKKVLAIFNGLTPDAVYERNGKFWRRRLETDQPGRQQ